MNSTTAKKCLIKRSEAAGGTARQESYPTVSVCESEKKPDKNAKRSENDPLLEQLLPHFNTLRMVDVQNCDRRAANSGDSENYCAIPSKIAPPILSARMKNHRNLTCLRVDSRQIWPLAEITSSAAKAEIIGGIAAAVLPWLDVLNMKTNEHRKLLRQMTVFAAIARSHPNQFANRSLHLFFRLMGK